MLKIVQLIKKFLTAKLDSTYSLVQFWQALELFSSNYFQIGQHVVLLQNYTSNIKWSGFKRSPLLVGFQVAIERHSNFLRTGS